MPYKRGRNYYVELRPGGYNRRVGPFSTRTATKAVAKQMEATVRELAATGRHDVLDALLEGEFTLPELHAAKVNGTLADLLDGIQDPPLQQVVEEFTATHDDSRYATALRRLLDTAPSAARLSWATDPANLRNHARRLRADGLAPATERREFAAISVMLREQLGDARRRQAMDGVQLRRVKNDRTRWLNTEEIARLREHAGEWWTVIAFALATGMRRGEVLAAKIRDIDFQAGAVVVPKGKSRRARRMIPLAGEALAMLRGWTASQELEPDDALFPGVDKWKLRYAWEQIREAAELDDVRFHDLRHTYAVHCAKAGMPLGELQQRLGHASIDQTMRYAVYAPSVRSTHYDAALTEMGMGEEDASATPLQPTGTVN